MSQLHRRKFLASQHRTPPSPHPFLSTYCKHKKSQQSCEPPPLRGLYTDINIERTTHHLIDTPAKMSRFFRGGDDSSSDSSSDEEELYSEQEEEEQEEQSEEDESEEEEDDDDDDSSSDSDAGKKQGGASRFLEGWSESEESDTEQTTKVKSAKDKRHDELDATVTLITNAEKINDWNTISNGNHLPHAHPNRACDTDPT